ncbi:MAG: substrate-binding domain-containing protein [Proteobacteria bacterium]|nr:substrate-binding domain-containing protein [Pseudomonadota bacterium]
MNARYLFMILSFVLSVLIGTVIARQDVDQGQSARKGGPDHEILIGLSLDTLQEARWQRDRDLFVGSAESMGAKVLVQAANSNANKQMTDISGLISRGVDVLVIVPYDGKAMGAAVDLAEKSNIPTIAYDRLITNTNHLDLYVTFDNIKVGEAQAQFLVDAVQAKPTAKIARIYGAPTDNNAKLFKEGQDNVLKPYIASGRIQVLHEDWAEEWKPENAKRIMSAAITKYGNEFDAVLASNDGTAGGVIRSLEEEGLAGKVLVTGQDAELVAIQRIVAGTQAMTVYKPVSKLATMAAELAVKLAQARPIVAKDELHNGRISVPAVYVPIFSVTRDRILDTVIKDGFHSYDDVYKGVLEAERPPQR